MDKCLAEIERERFQSTLLMRGATLDRHLRSLRLTYFNPRSSCEERLVR